MTNYVNWAGYLRGRATGWRLIDSSNPESQAIGIEIDLEAWEGLDSGEWSQLPVAHLQRAKVWVQKKNGELLAENVERLVIALGWDGSAATIDRTPELDQPVQWASKGEPSTKDPNLRGASGRES